MISFWFTKGGDCADQQDVVDAVYRRYRGRVNFLSLDVRDDRDTVRELVRQHGWKMPVGYDRDGAVASLYKVGGCPTFAYVYPGGTLQSASIGELTVAAAERPGRAAARAPAGRRKRADELPAPLSRGWAGTRPRSRAGWRPTSPPSSPASGSPGSRSTRGRASSPEPVRRRLRDLSDRFYGAQAIHLRERPIPWAYRVFFRQIGLDPDRTRTPVEQLALERLHDGAFKSDGLARRRADDRDRRDRGRPARLRRRPARRRPLHPRLGAGRVAAGPPGELAQGTLTIADEQRPGRACCSGATGEGYGVEPASRRLAIVAVQVKGVPQIAVDEALWMAAATLAASPPAP